MPDRDYYLVLGVSKEESPAAIRKAFRQLVKRYHPDLVGPQWLSRFKDVVEAYEVLSDPVLRDDYNRGLEQGLTEPSSSLRTGRGAPPRDPEHIIRRPRSVMKDFQSFNAPWDEILDRFLGNFQRRSIPKAEPTRSLTVEIILSPDEALTGGRLPLKVPTVVDCRNCGGAGENPPFRCSACDGQGWTEVEETVWLNIPARVGDGRVFEIPLQSLGIHNLYLVAVIRISRL